VLGAFRSLLRRTGFDVVRHQEYFMHPFDVLTPLVRDRRARDPRFNFVQIGANDGVVFDPIRDCVREMQLEGVLVEPVPKYFQALTTNYAGQPGLRFENAAVDRTDGSRVMYCIKDGSPLPERARALASFDRNHLTGKVHLDDHPDLSPYVEEVRVQTVSFPTLLRRHGLDRIGLLLVDTEGFDAEVVRMALDSGVLPEMIQYEFRHLSLADRAACKRRLRDTGYGFVDVGFDTLAAQLPT
jgi:FkbM family methyltransferase